MDGRLERVSGGRTAGGLWAGIGSANSRPALRQTESGSQAADLPTPETTNNESFTRLLATLKWVKPPRLSMDNELSDSDTVAFRGDLTM